MLLVQRERGGGGLLADQRVDHDHPGVTLDDAHHRQVEAAELVDAGHHLEQSVTDEELALPPQARVGGVGRRRSRKRYASRSHTTRPSAAVICRVVAAGDEATFGVVEVLGVVEREACVRPSRSLTPDAVRVQLGSVRTVRSTRSSSSRSCTITPTITSAMPDELDPGRLLIECDPSDQDSGHREEREQQREPPHRDASHRELVDAVADRVREHPDEEAQREQSRRRSTRRCCPAPRSE